MGVGENIRAARLRADLTQKKLGEKCGIAEPTIRRYELNKLNPKFDTLSNIADALGVSVARLIGYNVNEGFWTERFRNGLKERLADVTFDDAEDACFDMEGAIDIAEGVTGFTFEDACSIADGIGASLDELIDWDGAHGKNAEAYKQSLVADDTVDLTLMALLIKKKQNCPIEEAEKKAEIIVSCIQTKELSDELLQLNLAPKELQDIIRAALNQSKSDS